jgi:hypothetical protein
MRKLKQVAAALLAAGAVATLTWLAAGAPWPVAADSGGPAAPDASLAKRGTPLDCRLVPVPAAQRQAALKRIPWLRERFVARLDQAARRLADNPLVAGPAWFRVEVENTSGQDFAIYPAGDELFMVSTVVTDSAGRPLPEKVVKSFTSIKRLSPAPLAPEFLRPGQVVTQSLDLRLAAVDGPLRPGRYKVQAVCDYFRGPASDICRIKSPSLLITVSAAQVLEWKALQD